MLEYWDEKPADGGRWPLDSQLSPNVSSDPQVMQDVYHELSKIEPGSERKPWVSLSPLFGYSLSFCQDFSTVLRKKVLHCGCAALHAVLARLVQALKMWTYNAIISSLYRDS